MNSNKKRFSKIRGLVELVCLSFVGPLLLLSPYAMYVKIFGQDIDLSHFALGFYVLHVGFWVAAVFRFVYTYEINELKYSNVKSLNLRSSDLAQFEAYKGAVQMQIENIKKAVEASDTTFLASKNLVVEILSGFKDCRRKTTDLSEELNRVNGEIEELRKDLAGFNFARKQDSKLLLREVADFKTELTQKGN